MKPNANSQPADHADQGLSNPASSLNDAEAELAAIAEHFEALVLEDQQKAVNALRLAQEDAAQRSEHCAELHRICHDMKGQGSSFGYDLITEIAASLCALIRDRATVSDRQLELARLHLSAMEIVLKNKIKGQGGESGLAITNKLKALVESEQGQQAG